MNEDESEDTSTAQDKSNTFPVVPVAVSTSLLAVLLIIAVIIIIFRRRCRYHDYTPVSNDAIKPELNTAEQNIALNIPSKLPSDVCPTTAPSEGPRSRDSDNDHDSDLECETRRTADYPDGHIGKIWFSISYDSNSECLTVILHRIENLPDRSSVVKSCDPSVKISLLPSNKHLAQSRYKRKNNNPVFNETIDMNLPRYELNKSKMCLTVVDGYRSNKQTVIGHVIYPLNELRHTPTEVQQDLNKPSETLSNLGQLHVSLSYYPTLHRLTVIILRATNLKKTTQYRQTDSFVKVSFSIGNKMMKTKKTVVHTETQSPMYNDSFNFTVSEDDLGTSTLLISVMHSGGGLTEDKLIGRVLLGGRMYARGRACDHWVDMMNSPRKMIKCWHELQT